MAHRHQGGGGGGGAPPPSHRPRRRNGRTRDEEDGDSPAVGGGGVVGGMAGPGGGGGGPPPPAPPPPQSAPPRRPKSGGPPKPMRPPATPGAATAVMRAAALVLLAAIASAVGVRLVCPPARGSSVGSRRGGGWCASVALLSVPVLTALAVALRGRHANERAVAAMFVASVASNRLPRAVAKLGAAVAMAAFGVATRPAPDAAAGGHAGVGGRNPREKDPADPDVGKLPYRGGGGEGTSRADPPSCDGAVRRIPHRTRAFLSAFFMIAVLLTENFLVWVVSATYPASHDPPYPEPLQDNGRAVVLRLMDLAGLSRGDVQSLRDAFSVQWALVSSAVGGALLGCELGLGRARHRSIWAVGMRGVLTLGLARAVRGISFVLTVLPSQVRGCYRLRYPHPVPQDWWRWIAVGIKPAARGGCNDLIVSGHATVTSVLACVSASVGDNVWFSLAVWSLLGFDYLVEVLQGFHYSVDMWLGAVITSLIFRSLKVVEDTWDEEARPEFLPLRSATVQDGAVYGLPALLAFAVLTATREAIANVWILLYVLAAVTLQVKGLHHLSRHVLICTMYIALGVYL